MKIVHVVLRAGFGAQSLRVKNVQYLAQNARDRTARSSPSTSFSFLLSRLKDLLLSPLETSFHCPRLKLSDNNHGATPTFKASAATCPVSKLHEDHNELQELHKKKYYEHRFIGRTRVPNPLPISQRQKSHASAH